MQTAVVNGTPKESACANTDLENQKAHRKLEYGGYTGDMRGIDEEYTEDLRGDIRSGI